MTDIIAEALEHRLSEKEKIRVDRMAVLREIVGECLLVPDIDARSSDEILGYGENGAFSDGNR